MKQCHLSFHCVHLTEFTVDSQVRINYLNLASKLYNPLDFPLSHKGFPYLTTVLHSSGVERGGSFMAFSDTL